MTVRFSCRCPNADYLGFEATPEAIIAYSIEVAPQSLRMKRRTATTIASFVDFDMVFGPSGVRIIRASSDVKSVVRRRAASDSLAAHSAVPI